MKRYELIDNLTKVYFGQDYDYFGETGAEVMAEYRKASTPAELEALRAEIIHFMRSHPDLEAEFPRRFERPAQPEDFGSTMREFLESVLAALK
ncbi:hypothetical protein QFZ42_003676 [Variovorax paradoxus]|jgi:hypothetical protein|uniref:contact-dependent growth inhibition system immunity protein n=1 Tax=Variovorax paradoxus TaxID=34073 RepID=UPI0027941162|nr:contact-dependent growth inhibition system immunity protein [Variovorax paradoxus]MDQ0571842.1 hypothetical protein [Variovorax paradoxus]